MNQLTGKNTLLVSTSGSPVAADVITTANNVLVNPKSKSLEYKDMGNGKTGNTKSKTIADYTTADFKVEVNAKPSGTAGVAPAYGELFKLCGLSEVVDAGVSVTYAPATMIAGTAKAYLDGSVRTITGIAGDFTFGGQVGEIAKFDFSLKGFTDLAETVEVNPTVTLDANKNLTIESVTVITVGGSTINMESFEFSLGNETNETYAIGLKEFYIADFKSSIKVSAVKTKGNATHWADLAANTTREIIVVLGTVAGKTVTFKATYCNPSDVSENDSSGKVIYDNTWNCESSAGGDNFSIVYT